MFWNPVICIPTECKCLFTNRKTRLLSINIFLSSEELHWTSLCYTYEFSDTIKYPLKTRTPLVILQFIDQLQHRQTTLCQTTTSNNSVAIDYKIWPLLTTKLTRAIWVTTNKRKQRKFVLCICYLLCIQYYYAPMERWNLYISLDLGYIIFLELTRWFFFYFLM